MSFNNKSSHRTEFIVRFMCGAIFFGLVVGLLGLRFVTAVDVLAITVWILITVSLSVVVAVRGDDAWRRMAGIFRWW
jgi:hypothetical protein